LANAVKERQRKTDKGEEEEDKEEPNRKTARHDSEK